PEAAGQLSQRTGCQQRLLEETSGFFGRFQKTTRLRLQREHDALTTLVLEATEDDHLLVQRVDHALERRLARQLALEAARHRADAALHTRGKQVGEQLDQLSRVSRSLAVAPVGLV